MPSIWLINLWPSIFVTPGWHACAHAHFRVRNCYSRCQKSLYVYKRTLQKKGRSEFRGDAFVTLVTLDWTPAIIGVAARRADHSSASWNSRSRTAATGGITLLSSGTGPPASPRLLPVADCFYRRHNKNNQLITPPSKLPSHGVDPAVFKHVSGSSCPIAAAAEGWQV